MAQIRFDFENIKFRNEHVLREEIDSVENSVRIFFFISQTKVVGNIKIFSNLQPFKTQVSQKLRDIQQR